MQDSFANSTAEELPEALLPLWKSFVEKYCVGRWGMREPSPLEQEQRRIAAGKMLGFLKHGSAEAAGLNGQQALTDWQPMLRAFCVELSKAGVEDDYKPLRAHITKRLATHWISHRNAAADLPMASSKETLKEAFTDAGKRNDVRSHPEAHLSLMLLHFAAFGLVHQRLQYYRRLPSERRHRITDSLETTFDSCAFYVDKPEAFIPYLSSSLISWRPKGTTPPPQENSLSSDAVARIVEARTAVTMDGEIRETELRDRIVHALLHPQVTERQRNYVIAHYGLDGQPPRSMENIAGEHGRTRQGIGQQLGSAMEKLRPFLSGLAEDHGWDPDGRGR